MSTKRHSDTLRISNLKKTGSRPYACKEEEEKRGTGSFRSKDPREVARGSTVAEQGWGGLGVLSLGLYNHVTTRMGPGEGLGALWSPLLLLRVSPAFCFRLWIAG